MKKLIITVLALAILLPCTFAQVPAAGAGAGVGADAQLFSIELGLPIGYRISDGALVSGRAFGLNIAVADNFLVGISSTQIGTAAPLTAYNTLRLSYTIMPLLGTSIFIGKVGTTTTTAAGLGFYSTIAQGRNAAGLGTGLRLRVDYLFDTADLAGGSVLFTTSVLFGM